MGNPMVERWWWKQKSTTEGYCKSLQFGGNVERIVGTTCSLMVSSGADIAHSYLVSSASFQLPTDWSDVCPTTYSVTDRLVRLWSDDLLSYRSTVVRRLTVLPTGGADRRKSGLYRPRGQVASIACFLHL